MAETMDTDVAIGGGGIAGSVAAVALSKLGFHVTLIEPNLHSERRQGGEMLHPRGIESLSQLGLLANVRAAGSARIRGFHISDTEAGDVTLAYAKIGLSPGMALDHGRLHAVLFAAASSCRNVSVIHGKRVTGLNDRGDHVEIHVTGKGAGTKIRARLLVGADGARSKIRERAGIPCGRRRVSMISTVTLPADALPDAEFGHLFIGAGGPSLAYPIGEGRARLMVDHDGRVPHSIREVAALLSAACPPRFRKQVGELADDQRVRHFATEIVFARTPHRGRVVLIGDAACTCHPLTASGMTSAIADVVSLAGALRDRPDDIARALDHHAAQCRPRQTSRLTLASAVHEVLASATPEHALLRLGMMRYWASAHGALYATALLSMAEERPAKLWRAMSSALGYGLRELLKRSPAIRPGNRWRTGLNALRVVTRYRVRSIVGTGHSSVLRRSALL